MTRCDGVEDYNTFEEIHCLRFKFLVLFLSHIGPLFLSQHICMPNIVFLLKMWVQFLMYDACQHLSGHITSKNLFKTKIWFWSIYTGAGHIIRISSKSWFISLIPFKKWNLYNVYIHSTQTDIFQVFISFNFDDYNWQLMKTPNSVSQKIRILLKTNTKKGFLEILANWKVWTWKVWACTALNT